MTAALKARSVVICCKLIVLQTSPAEPAYRIAHWIASAGWIPCRLHKSSTLSKKVSKPAGFLEKWGAARVLGIGIVLWSTMIGGVIRRGVRAIRDVEEDEGGNTKTGSGIGGVNGGVVVNGGGVIERGGVTG